MGLAYNGILGLDLSNNSLILSRSKVFFIKFILKYKPQNLCFGGLTFKMRKVSAANEMKNRVDKKTPK
jgi:hypothetical protein